MRMTLLLKSSETLLIRMKPQRRSRQWFEFYERAFRIGVHQLLAWGYLDARPNIGPNAAEDAITGQIIECIKDRLDDPNTPHDYTRFYNVVDQDPVRRSGKRGKLRPILDIVMTCSIRLPRPEFMFEAKRLKANGFPIGLYLGNDGLLCFVRGQYAAEYSTAGMLGYIQSHDASRWIKQLDKKLSGNGRKDLRVIKNLSKVRVHSSIDHEFTSMHGRIKNSNILIFHVLLDCT